MTMTASSDPQVLSILDNLRQLSAQVQQIDAELGTDVSGPQAAKNKLKAQYVEQYSGDEGFKNFISKVVSTIRDHFSDTPEYQIAVFTELGNQMDKAFGDTIKNHLQKVIDSQPKPEPTTITDARKAELADARSKAANIFKLQKEMLKYYDVLELPSDIVEPPVRRGSIGPRGAAFTKTYQYYFDGKLQQLTDSDGVKSDSTLSNLVSKTKDAGLKSTKELRDYIMAQLNVTPSADGKTVELPDSWSVTLPAPVSKELRGVVSTTATVDESDDGDDDTANGTETETGTEDMFASA